MSSSHHPRFTSTGHSSPCLPARTPGSLGINDHGDPNVPAFIGDNPGSLGLNDGGDPGAGRRSRRSSALLLDRVLLAQFLRSVAYVQITAEQTTISKKSIGIGVSISEVDTTDEKVKQKLVNARVHSLMQEFAQTCSGGSKGTVRFLENQAKARDEGRARIAQVFATASHSNEATANTLRYVGSGLKTVEISAGMLITVASLFVAAPAALAAGIIGFGYGVTTKIIDKIGTAQRIDADTMALVSLKVTGKSLLGAVKKKAEDLLAAHTLEDVEELERSVAHLDAKIATKRAMILGTKSARNTARLTRSIRKNQSAIYADVKTIARFRLVTFVFALWELKEGAEEIKKTWEFD